jgi:hypothetical protein
MVSARQIAVGSESAVGIHPRRDLMTRTAIAVVGLALAFMVSASVVCLGAPNAGVPGPPASGDPDGRDGRTYAVLWDLSHGPHLDYGPSGRFSDLADTLSFYEMNSYETTMSLEFVGLEAYDMIVIGMALAWESGYTPAEVAAIEAYVEGGGGLLVMLENHDMENDHITPVSEVFGVTVSDSTDYVFVVTDLDGIDLFEDVSSLRFGTGGGLVVTSPSTTVARSSEGEPVVALMGDCNVIVTGDGNLWDNDGLPYHDDQAFALNVFRCLCGADTPVERSSWGTIKSLYR